MDIFVVRMPEGSHDDGGRKETRPVEDVFAKVGVELAPNGIESTAVHCLSCSLTKDLRARAVLVSRDCEPAAPAFLSSDRLGTRRLSVIITLLITKNTNGPVPTVRGWAVTKPQVRCVYLKLLSASASLS